MKRTREVCLTLAIPEPVILRLLVYWRAPNTERSISAPVNQVMVGTLPDVIAERLAVVFCGINPGMTAAAVGHHFAGRGNRFWRVIHLAGFTPEEILPENDRTILQHRFGLTAVVDRPTAQADQLSARDSSLSPRILNKKSRAIRLASSAF